MREQEILIAGMLSKSHILDILKNYVLYEVINNKKIKKVAKHQQYRVVTKAIDRLHTDKDSTGNKSTLSGKGGVIWHTQGSGKSISMLWLATQLMYKFGNPPILIVTDRKQLDKQIHETFKTCGFPTPIKARTSSHLQTLLQNPQGKTIMTTIQKFGTKSGLIETNAKVIVLVDEGHRTQYKFNAAAMREALPNGTFFAFTGTPIDKKEKSTYRVFGPLLDRYSFDESKADGATLAIKYEGRMAELFIEGEDETIEQVFDRVFSDQTKDVKDKLKKQYVTKEKILEAPSRIKKVCFDVIDHFSQNVKPNGFKAMLVASSRQAAVTYKKELDNLNGPISKVIMTSKLGEKGSDSESWDRYYLTDEQREKEETYFKSPEDPTQILIVVDMLLVGYDAPIVQTLYLDRVIREHTLLQAIARVNRPYRPEKQYGLIIDYCGITRELQQALAIFDEQDVQDVLIPFDTEIEQLKLRHSEVMSSFSDINRNNFDEIILKFEPVNVREDFEYAFKMFTKALDSVLPRREANQYKDDFTFLAKTRQRLKNIYGGVGLSLKIEGNKVQQMINDIIRSSKISTLIEEIEVTDKTFLSEVLKETKNKKARTALVKNKVRQIIEEKAHLNPAYYEKMKERLEAIIREEREERREDADYFNRYENILKDLYGQEEERKKLGFTNSFEFAVYETLLKEVDDGNFSKDITKKIFEGIKEEITNISDWQNKLTSQKKLESTIYDILNETGNKKIENNIDEIIEQVIELAKRNLK
ncbi:MAG: type I restriction endonuclease subunit R [Nitrososphaeraceae archaeon]